MIPLDQQKELKKKKGKKRKRFSRCNLNISQQIIYADFPICDAQGKNTYMSFYRTACVTEAGNKLPGAQESADQSFRIALPPLNPS